MFTLRGIQRYLLPLRRFQPVTRWIYEHAHKQKESAFIKWILFPAAWNWIERFRKKKKNKDQKRQNTKKTNKKKGTDSSNRTDSWRVYLWIGLLLITFHFLGSFYSMFSDIAICRVSDMENELFHWSIPFFAALRPSVQWETIWHRKLDNIPLHSQVN